MLTEEKNEQAPPELYVSNGRYYIMDRRTKPQDKPDEANGRAEEQAPEPEAASTAALQGFTRTRRENSGAGYLLLGALGFAAGAAVAVLYPPEGMFTAPDEFIEALADRLLHCGAFLAAEFVLGYFAAGGVLVWILPLLYSLGAGLTAAMMFAAGSPLAAATQLLYTAVLCFGAARSAEFSSLLLGVASGRGGSVVTDGNAGRSYVAKFGVYLMFTTATAIAEAAML